MKVLVTGVAGCIGYHLEQRLLAEGMQVYGIDNINDYYDVNLKKIGYINYIHKPDLLSSSSTWLTAKAC